MSTVEARLAAHVRAIEPARVPAATRARVAELLLDLTACMLAGLASPECARLARRAANRGGEAESSVVGLPTRLPALSAAHVNAALAHWYEWDDVYDAGGLHASAVIFPVLLACAEEAQQEEGAAAGEAFVAAALGAFDLAGRISGALTPYCASGWMPTGFASTVGAAAGAARLYGLDEAGVLAAMGIAGAGVGLSRQPIADKVDGKNVLCALAATRAVEAAALAADGIRGAPHFLSGPMGLNALLTGARADLEKGMNDLGRRWCADEVSYKPFPSCRATHSAVDLALRLRAETGIAAGDIARVEALVPQPMADMCGAPFAPGENPRVAAQFSIAYTVARAFADGSVGLAAFDVARVGADAAVLDLAGRVETRGAPVAPGRSYLGEPVTLRVVRRDGATLERTTPLVKGSPAHPMSAAECRAKLEDCAAGRLDAAQAQALHAAVMAVEQRGVAPLLRILRSARRPQAN